MCSFFAKYFITCKFFFICLKEIAKLMFFLSKIQKNIYIFCDRIIIKSKKKCSFLIFLIIVRTWFILVYALTLMENVHITVCPRSLDPFYIISYDIEWDLGQTVVYIKIWNDFLTIGFLGCYMCRRTCLLGKGHFFLSI